MNNNKYKLIVIEELNLISIIYLMLRWHQLDEVVYFSKSDFWRSEQGERWLEWLGKFRQCKNSSFPGTYVNYHTFSAESYLDATYEASVNVTEGFYTAYRANNPYIIFLLRLKNNQLVEIALKKSLLMSYIIPRMRGYVLLKKVMESQPNSKVTFIPCDNIDLGEFISKDYFVRQRLDFVPSSIKAIYKIKAALTKLTFIFYIHWLLLALIRRGISWNNFIVQKFDICYGINKPMKWANEYFHTFIYDNELFKSDQVLLMVDKTPNDKVRRDFDARGYPYAEFRGSKIPLIYFLNRVIRNFYINSMWCLASSLSKPIPDPFIQTGYTIARNIIETELFHIKYLINVFIARDESTYRHIVRRIILNEQGGKMVGYPTGDAEFINNEFVYISMDYFCIWGEYRKNHTYHHSIDNFEVIGAGFPGLDRTYQLCSENVVPEKYKKIKQDYQILLAIGTCQCLDSDRDFWATKEQVLEYYKATLALLDINKKIFMIWKPRGNEITDEEFMTLIGEHDRVCFEKNIQSYDMLPLADFAICILPTSMGIESIMTNNKVLYYDAFGIGKWEYCSRYHERLVSRTPNELYENMQWLLAGNSIPQKTLTRLQYNHGYKFDGKTVERFKQVVRKVLSEASSNYDNPAD
jgi:polysaccharide biosynthesis PFTS motif protein